MNDTTWGYIFLTFATILIPFGIWTAINKLYWLSLFEFAVAGICLLSMKKAFKKPTEEQTWQNGQK